MNKNEFSYALHDIRIGLEKGVKCVICHTTSYYDSTKSLASHIKFCENNGLIPEKLINKLYGAKDHCNSGQHDNDCEKNYNQVFFSYKVLEELNDYVKQVTVI